MKKQNKMYYLDKFKIYMYRNIIYFLIMYAYGDIYYMYWNGCQ